MEYFSWMCNLLKKTESVCWTLLLTRILNPSVQEILSMQVIQY